jgi:hypothetical protein
LIAKRADKKTKLYWCNFGFSGKIFAFPLQFQTIPGIHGILANIVLSHRTLPGKQFVRQEKPKLQYYILKEFPTNGF